MMKTMAKRSLASGFSLIELMVAMGILTVLMLMLTVLLDQIQKSWRFSEARVSQFREARVAFDLMAKNLGQASLNTYWDMVVDENEEVQGYAPTSELHFVALRDVGSELPGAGTQTPMGHGVFFQAPLGFSPKYRNLNNLFNGRGYFVSFGSDERFKPSFVKARNRYRFRLMEFRPPAESNQVFQDGLDERENKQEQVFDQWYKQALSVGDGNFEEHLNPLAENIIAIVISPRDSLDSAGGSRRENFSEIAPRYSYDSNDPAKRRDPNDEFSSFAQQVPPLVRLTMVAIDEGSFVRAESGTAPPPQIMMALSGKFTQTESFSRDIEELSRQLSGGDGAGGGIIEHKIFSTMVMLRSAKWTGK